MDRDSYHSTGGGDGNRPQEKEMKEGKCLSEEALQIPEKREARGKGERKRYTHLMYSTYKLNKQGDNIHLCH